MNRLKKWTAALDADRRAHPRSPAGFVADVIGVNGSRCEPSPAIVEDISLGGIALSTSLALELGARVWVSVLFPGERAPSDVDVEVVGVGERQIPLGRFVHCRFVALPEDVHRLILAWSEAHGTAVTTAPMGWSPSQQLEQDHLAEHIARRLGEAPNRQSTGPSVTSELADTNHAMRVRVGTWRATPEQLEGWVQRISEAKDRIHRAHGVVAAYWLVDRQAGIAQTITVWDSEESMLASESGVGSDEIRAAVLMEHYEVIDPSHDTRGLRVSPR